MHPLLRGTHTHTYTPPPIPFPHPSSIWRRRSIEMSHLQPRWKRTLTSSSSSSVTVWTLMKKRWVLSCAPIYLSGQGTCTLIPAFLPLSLSCLSSLTWCNFFNRTFVSQDGYCFVERFFLVSLIALCFCFILELRPIATNNVVLRMPEIPKDCRQT